jgi:hypothetical protein
MMSINRTEKRMRFAGTCLAIGLLVEALCLLWATPIAFIVFVAIGGLLILVGLVIYLHSQVSNSVASD